MLNNKKILCLICARGGSKGIPKKNLVELGGKSLIKWSVDMALQLNFIDRIVVSTDCQEIASVAKLSGVEVPFMRPKELAHDNSPEWQVWQHAIKKLENNEQFKSDCLLVLSPTSPFRSKKDIENGFNQYFVKNADIVVSVKDSSRNPYFNMLEINDNDCAVLCKQLDNNRVYRRQDAPAVFDMTTVCYIANTDFVLKSDSMFQGKVQIVKIPDDRALDIDTPLDLKFAEFLLQSGFINEND